MGISPKDIWQSSGYENVLGNTGSHPLRQNRVHVSHMANDCRNHWAFGWTTSSSIFFRVRFIRFDLTVSNKSCSEDKGNGESSMGQAWKRCQAALQWAAAGHSQQQNSKRTGHAPGENTDAYDLIPLRLLARLEDKKKGDPELDFGFSFLNPNHNSFSHLAIKSFALKRWMYEVTLVSNLLRKYIATFCRKIFIPAWEAEAVKEVIS